MPLRASSQIRDRDLRGGKLDGMTDIPFFKLPRVGLQVKLERKRVASVAERLVLVVSVRCQSGGFAWQIERVPMPMQNDGVVALQRLQTGRSALLRQIYRAPADFLDRALENPAAQRSRHELTSETNSDRWNIA